MPVTSLQELYLQKLQLIFDAEQRALQVFPRITQLAQNPDLRDSFEVHRLQSEEQVRRLEQLFRARGQSPQPVECQSMRALIQEAEQVLAGIQDADTRDAFLIGAQQAVEHHEIAAYGTARTWAQQLGFDEDATVLQEILEQEKNTDLLLTEIAERMVNPDAAQQFGERDVTARAQPADAAAGSASTSSSPYSTGAETRTQQGDADRISPDAGR